jgi:hypothetical protein
VAVAVVAVAAWGALYLVGLVVGRHSGMRVLLAHPDRDSTVAKAGATLIIGLVVVVVVVVRQALTRQQLWSVAMVVLEKQPQYAERKKFSLPVVVVPVGHVPLGPPEVEPAELAAVVTVDVEQAIQIKEQESLQLPLVALVERETITLTVPTGLVAMVSRVSSLCVSRRRRWSPSSRPSLPTNPR